MSDHSTDATDQALVAAVGDKNQDALRELYARHGLPILSFLIGRLGDRQIAEEVLQDVMLAVWQGATSFRGGSQVRTWMLAIAIHKANRARQRKRLPQESFTEDLADPSQDDRFDLVLDRADVRVALSQLPDVQRETLELIFYHELNGPETAKVLGVPLSTVKTRLYRALATLRERMQKEPMHHV